MHQGVGRKAHESPTPIAAPVWFPEIGPAAEQETRKRAHPLLKPSIEIQRFVAVTFRESARPPLASATLVRCALRGAALEFAAALRRVQQWPDETAAQISLETAAEALKTYRSVLYVCLRTELLNTTQYDGLHIETLLVERLVRAEGHRRARLAARGYVAPARRMPTTDFDEERLGAPHQETPGQVASSKRQSTADWFGRYPDTPRPEARGHLVPRQERPIAGRDNARPGAIHPTPTRKEYSHVC